MMRNDRSLHAVRTVCPHKRRTYSARVAAFTALATLSSMLVASAASAAGPRGGAEAAAAATATARTQGHRVEVLDQESEFRKVFAEPDGTFTAKFFLRPVQVRRGARWVRVAGGSLRRRGAELSRPISRSLGASGAPIRQSAWAMIAQSGWTKVVSGRPTTSYWLGGSDGPTARAGMCTDPGCNGIARSYFQYDHRGLLFGKTIQSAEFRAVNTVSPSCMARPIDLWNTDSVSSATTWQNQPWSTRVLVGTHLGSHGHGSACPTSTIAYDVTQTVIARVSQGAGTFTYALASGDETDPLAYKVFDSNPSLVVVYS